MAKLLVTSAAELDFTKALRWYAQQSQRAAEAFDAEFEEILRVIEADPNCFPLCDQRHRFCLMRRYPYQVIYREYGDAIAVIAVAHAKRKPGYWENR
jgi:plasmid stabilization system protein ParE